MSKPIIGYLVPFPLSEIHTDHLHTFNSNTPGIEISKNCKHLHFIPFYHKIISNASFVFETGKLSYPPTTNAKRFFSSLASLHPMPGAVYVFLSRFPPEKLQCRLPSETIQDHTPDRLLLRDGQEYH